MKRDWDLIRKILLQVESLGDTQSQIEGVEGMDAENVSYHINLMVEAGLVIGDCTQGLDGPLRCSASLLTWAGHEFLDKIRSAGVWNKVKAMAREKGLSLSFEMIKTAAGCAITALLGG